MIYIRFFFVLYWFALFLKFGPLPSENPRCASAGKHKLSKNKLMGWASKYKLGAEARKYKLRAEGQGQGRGPGNTNTHLKSLKTICEEVTRLCLIVGGFEENAPGGNLSRFLKMGRLFLGQSLIIIKGT